MHEKGTRFRKWHPDRPSFLLVYPNLYKAGISSFGMQVINGILSEYPEIFHDRLYVPNSGEVGDLRSVQYKMHPKAFSIVGFNCSFELDYLNILKILRNSDIPLLSSERRQLRAAGMKVPVVIAGGVAISTNPLPLMRFMDFIFLFDAEVSFNNFIGNVYRRHDDFLRDLSSWWKDFLIDDRRGIIPSFTGKNIDDFSNIERGIMMRWHHLKLDNLYYPTRQVLPVVDHSSRYYPSLGDSYALEVGRGCSEGCRFCLLSYHQRPPRFRSISFLKNLVDRASREIGEHGKIILIGSNTSEHPDLYSLCEYILEKGHVFSLPSIKPLENQDMMVLIKRAKIRTMTIAPETGSERLRGVIGKKVSNVAYLDLIQQMSENGVQKIKIYLIHGLPTESEEDLNETLGFLEELAFLTRSKGLNLDISLNPFIPKLGTPFMFHVDNFLSSNFRRYKKNFVNFKKRVSRVVKSRLNSVNFNDVILQAILSLGDASLQEYLLSIDFSFHSGRHVDVPEEKRDSLFLKVKAFLDQEFFPDEYSFIPIPLKFLKKEWKNAFKGKVSPRCLGVNCNICGHFNCK
ncbi:MAG: radical SAM protein [Promethearchaeota archaeon]